jgi:hypothetical protein
LPTTGSFVVFDVQTAEDFEVPFQPEGFVFAPMGRVVFRNSAVIIWEIGPA